MTLCTWCSALQCEEQSLGWYLGTRSCRCSRQGFWKGLCVNPCKGFIMPFPSKFLFFNCEVIVQISLCHQAMVHRTFNWSASRMSRKRFSIQQCELQFGNVEWSSVCYSCRCPTGGRSVPQRNRWAPFHIAVPVCSTTTSRISHLLLRGVCICFHHTAEAHLCHGEFWENTEGSGRWPF